MLQSVTKEKENRTVEILLVSLRPRELMSGKILGLGVVALLQVVIWAGGGLLVLKSNPLSGVTLPDGFLIWALPYFILGYLLYASILGAIGALVPSAREGAQFTFIVMLPLMLPLWLSNIFIESPNEPVSVFFHLVPADLTHVDDHAPGSGAGAAHSNHRRLDRLGNHSLLLRAVVRALLPR